MSALNSFELDEICRANLHRAGAPIADYAEPTTEELFERAKEAWHNSMDAQKALTRAWINFALWLGFVFGISCSALVARIAGVL